MLDSKNDIRNRMMTLRDQLSFDERKQLSGAICERLMKAEAWQACEKVFTYRSFRSEVDTDEIINRALEDGKRVYLPRVQGKTMDFFEIQALEGLILNRFQIPEPPFDEDRRYKEKQEDGYTNLMLLPGLAFDLQGSRIGYGAGYYDKYLALYEKKHFYKIALAYELQLVDKINALEFDIRADAILTPSRLILCVEQV